MSNDKERYYEVNGKLRAAGGTLQHHIDMFGNYLAKKHELL